MIKITLDSWGLFGKLTLTVKNNKTKQNYMTPMPVNPKIVILVDEEGTLRDNRSNIVNDEPLEIVVCYSVSEFKHASLGLPYTGTAVLVGDEKS